MTEKEKALPKLLIISMFIPLFVIIFLSIPLLINQINFQFPINDIRQVLDIKTIQGFTTIFISIILEAIPFIILGTFVSSLIQIFVTEEKISRIIPKNKFLGLLCAALIGLIFPVCDCAIVPIVTRLIKKGLPLNIAITFMLATPIVNPVVLSSTYYAFSNNPSMLLIRGCLGIISAIIIGYLIGITEGENNILKNKKKYITHSYNHDEIVDDDHDENCSCGHKHSHHHEKEKSNLIYLLIEVFEHTSVELHDVGRFLIIGSFLSALMQTFIPRKYIIFIGQDKIYSVLIMIALAFLLAVCSETDAFIARTFVGQFTTGSIIAFLIFGPMIDIKNTLMLSGIFKFRFVFKLIFIIFIICSIIGITLNFIIYNGGMSWLNLIKMNLSGF